MEYCTKEECVELIPCKDHDVCRMCKNNDNKLYKKIYSIDGVEQQIIICDFCIDMCSCSFSKERCSSCKGIRQAYDWLNSPERATALKIYESKSSTFGNNMNPKTQYGYLEEYGCSSFAFTKEYKDAHEVYLNRVQFS